MLKNLLVSFVVLATLSCTAMRESSARSDLTSNSRADSFERARGLYQIGEVKSALKTLDRIMDERPLDRLSVEAALLSADIHASQKQSQKALEVLQRFESNAKGKKLDLSRITAAKRRIISDLAKPEASEQELSEKEKPQANEVVTAPSLPMSNFVGVLLPLSGPFKIYGERALEAMRLAFDPTSSQQMGDVTVLQNADGISLVVMDTKGQAQVAQKAVEQLVQEFKCVFIVGDILSETALAIAQKANELGVINLSLSRKEGLTNTGARTFRMAMTARKQIAALLSLEEGNNPHKRFAILYPQNPYGIEMRDAFANEVQKRGAQVVKAEGYRPEETTFTPYIRKMVGAKRTTGNTAYAECLERTLRLSDASARKKAEGDCYEAVAPTIPFDALFIPEFPKTLGYIVPALISEGVMVSQNENMVRSYRRTSHVPDAEPVQLLGPSSWNSSVIAEKLGSQVDGAIFVDGGDLFNQREIALKFVSRFEANQSSAPTLTEALAHDAILTVLALYQSKPVDIEQVTKRLEAVQLEGASGKISFDQERDSVLPFRWFAFQEGKILPKS